MWFLVAAFLPQTREEGEGGIRFSLPPFGRAHSLSLFVARLSAALSIRDFVSHPLHTFNHLNNKYNTHGYRDCRCVRLCRR